MRAIYRIFADVPAVVIIRVTFVLTYLGVTIEIDRLLTAKDGAHPLHARTIINSEIIQSL